MNTHADKTQENKSQSVAKKITHVKEGGMTSFQFKDNRPETIVQRKLNEIANSSSPGWNAAQLNSTLNHSRKGIFQDKNAENKSLQLKDASKNIQQSLSSEQIIQMAPWTNENAKFKTDNEMPDVPNSEYLVESTSYKRYAPINEVRAPGQMFHEGPRSFAYLDHKDQGNKAIMHTKKAQPQAPDNSTIKLEAASGESVFAHKTPSNGLEVWDGDVSDDGTVTDLHPGHAVIELGMPLPHIETPELIKEARAKQLSVKIAQTLGIVDSDDVMAEKVYKISDDRFGGDDNAALSYLANNPDEFPALKAAKAKAQLNK